MFHLNELPVLITSVIGLMVCVCTPHFSTRDDLHLAALTGGYHVPAFVFANKHVHVPLHYDKL